MTTTKELSSQGYALLAEGVPSGKCNVDVWQRLSKQQEGWDYVVSLPGTTPGSHEVLNLDRPLTISPNVVDIGRLLVKAKALKRKPGLGYEYAINVNSSNDYEGNFAHEELRDRAIDELILAGQVGLDDSICCFEIEPNGDQPGDKDSYVDLKSWIRDRGLAGPSKAPASRLRLAILVGDTGMAEEALKAGASPSVGSKQHPMPPLILAAATGRDRIIAAMAEISPHLIDVDARHSFGNSALHLAAGHQHKAACLELLHLGASVNVGNDAGQTPVEVATAVAGNQATDLLIAARAKQAAMEAIGEIAGIGLDVRP